MQLGHFKKIVFKPQCILLKLITGETVDEYKNWQGAMHQLPEQHLDGNVQNNKCIFQYLWLDAQSKAKVNAPYNLSLQACIKHQFQAFHVFDLFLSPSTVMFTENGEIEMSVLREVTLKVWTSVHTSRFLETHFENLWKLPLRFQCLCTYTSKQTASTKIPSSLPSAKLKSSGTKKVHWALVNNFRHSPAD